MLANPAHSPKLLFEVECRHIGSYFYLKILLFVMFKFNFGNEEELPQERVHSEENDRWYKSKKMDIPTDIFEAVRKISRNQITKLSFSCGLEFSCLSSKEALNMLKEKSGDEEFLDVLKADKQHSDLIPGKYEGGLKTWECTKDLAVYFMQNVMKEKTEKLYDKTVLDLGCGTGLLGIMCLLLDASVVFQDYNQEVLEAVTIPNIFLNCQHTVRDKIKLYCGDWSSFLELMLDEIEKDRSKNVGFDYILTSETIYNPTNYLKIISIIKRLLKSNGVAFVAAKSHYFGVGGNLNEFKTVLEQEGFSCSLVWESEEGVSRGILKVWLK